MTQLQQKVAVPDAVLEKLDEVRGRTLKVRIGTAIVVALGVLLAAMALAMLVDRLAVLYDSRWRLVLTYSSLGAAVLTLGVWLVTAWRQSQQLQQAASDVDHEIPQLEERWSTIAQLSTSQYADQVHPAMYRKVAKEAAGWSPRVEPGEVVSLDRLIRSLWCLMALTVVMGLAVVIDTHQTSVLLRRFWSPQAPIYATEFAEATESVVVARGEALELEAKLEGSPVEQATLYLEPNEGEAQTVTLVPKGQDEDRVAHRIRSVKTDLRYRLRAGDGQTPWYQVEVADRPRLGEVQVTVIPPRYTGLASEQFDKLPRKISTLKGSLLQLALKPKEAVEKVELQFDEEQLVALTADEDGWCRWESTVEESFALSPVLTESHGLTNSRPPTCEIKCREDAPPVVKILKPDDQIAVLPNDTVPIEFSAKDDLGIGSAELLVYDDSLAVEGEPLPLATIPIPLGEQIGSAEVFGTVNLDLTQFELSNGAQLSFAIRVSEDRSALANNNDLQRPQNSEEEMQEVAVADSDREQIAEDVASKSPKAAAETDATTGKSAEDDVARADSQKTDREAASSQSPKSTSSQPSKLATTDSQADGSEKSATDTPKPTTDSAALTPEPEQSDIANSTTDTTPEDEKEASQPQADSSVANSDGSTEHKQTSAASKSSAAADQPEEPAGSSNVASLQTGYLKIPEPQSASSNRMQLMVDETATSFDGQRRIELELAIAPYLEDIDVALAKAQLLSRSVLDESDKNPEWQPKHGRDINKAEGHVAEALNAVDELHNRTRGTLYAFVGLQLIDISQAHIYPARQEFWKGLQTEGDPRIVAVRDGWQHTGRARDLLGRLTDQFEKARRDYSLADTVNKIKKMYQVYVENSLAMLRESSESSPYSRKMAEFDLDDEYLARLKEVLEMRNEMRAELARLLADDPRLLRRFLDAQRNRTKILRYELADLAEQQGGLNRKVKAWNVVEEDRRSDLAAILLQRHVKGIEEIALSAADLHDRFETWLPLNRDAEDVDLLATGELLQQIATSTREVSASAGGFAGRKTGVSPTASPETTSPEAGKTEADKNTSDDDNSLDAIVGEAEQLYEQFNRLEVLLSQLGMREGQVEIAGFATNRLIETRRLVERISAWIRQLQHHQAGEFHRAAEIQQYQLAMATDALAGKFADLEQQLSATLQIRDGTLPEPIAEKARGLLAALDEQAAPNQLAAVYGLRRNQLPRAVSRQESALKALQLAEKEYDAMIDLVLKELDKFPVQDPIASLLNDPTLDELLRQLEQEVPLNEVLGIPARPTNLQIMGDWLSGGMGSGAIGYNANQVLMNKMREEQMKRQRAIEQAFRKALARALKESQAEGVVDPAAPARKTVDWNDLASKLGDDLQQGRNTAPPERYRRAIEQYFRQISGGSEEE